LNGRCDPIGGSKEKNFLLSARKLSRGVFDFSQRNPLLALLLSAVSSPFLHAFLGRDINNFSQKWNNRNGGNKHGRLHVPQRPRTGTGDKQKRKKREEKEK
jgi:hypothetical protein